MTPSIFMKDKPALSPYKKGDVLVLFGELFQRGYANGLVEQAEKQGLTIIRATVGRREAGVLRALNAEEMKDIPKPFINVPLEAGFDLEPDSEGRSPVDQIKDLKLSDWQKAHIDFAAVEESRKNGAARFRKHVQEFLQELEPLIPPGANVLFAHLMAGGVPRTKIVMPLMNRAFKGTGERYLSSEEFWNSQIGRLCALSFTEVTAETLRHLLELSKPLREKLEARGQHVSYLAYGYHGTEVLIEGEYKWQTYSPYLQGWAKMQLEDIAREAFAEDIKVCVYNCPEILTNSSSIFQGVEVSLYPLIGAIQKECGNAPEAQAILNECKALLKEGVTLPGILKYTDAYLTLPLIVAHCHFEEWPQHSSQEQLETMLRHSEELFEMHKDPKKLMTAVLSEVVFKSCGYVMLNDSWDPQNPVAWIGHDLVAKVIH